MKILKTHFLIALFGFLQMLLATPLPGQKISRQIIIGGDLEDYFDDGIQTRDNGYLLVCTSLSGISGDKTEECFGMYDYWVIKTNKKGKINWQRTLGGDNEDDPRAVLETTDSGFLICGTSRSGVSGNKEVVNVGETDFWVVKLDKNGKTLWQNGYGSKNVDQFISVMNYPEGGYLLAGYSWFNPSELPAGSQKGRYDYWLVLIAENGDLLWEQSIGGNQDDILTNATIDHTGNIILAGYSLSGANGDKSEPSLGNNDLWTICLNKERKIVWQKTLGTDKNDQSTCVREDDKHHYHTAGMTPVSAADQNLIDFWIFLLDENGIPKTELKIGGDDSDFLSAMVPLKDDGMLYAGYSRSGISRDKTEASYGDYDGWMIKYNSSGKPVWDKTIGGIKYDAIRKIVSNNNKHYTLFMMSNSGKTGNLKKAGKGKTDMLMIRLKDKAR